MNTYLKRIIKREQALEQWLIKNNAKDYLDKTTYLLNDLPKDAILLQFTEGLKKGLQHCVQNQTIKALDYSWYFSTKAPTEALAYGLDMHKTKGTLSKTDLGPDNIPGIEIKSEAGNIVDEYFASLPVEIALNLWTEKLSTDINSAISNNQLHSDVELSIVELIQLWNYKLGIKAGESLLHADEVQKLKNRSPFWITMTSHERWSVPIMLIN